MSIEISIEEFLRTGKFGPVELGIAKAKVLSILGAPDSETDLGETGSILLYSWYELFFNHEQILHSIQNDNYDSTKKETYTFSNESFHIDSWFLSDVKNQNIFDISKIFEEKNLEYEITDYYGREVLKLESGVIVDFDEEKNESDIKSLTGFRFWPNICA